MQMVKITTKMNLLSASIFLLVACFQQHLAEAQEVLARDSLVRMARLVDGSSFGHLNESNFIEMNQQLISFSDELKTKLSQIDQSSPLMKSSRVQEKCLAKLGEWAIGVTTGESWALGALDAFGKLPSGLTMFNLLWPGQYSQCIAINDEKENVAEQWRGKYCYTNLDPTPVAGPELAAQGIRVRIGICVPSECTSSDLINLVNETLSNFEINFPLDDSSIECQESRKFDALAYCGFAFFGVLIVLAFFGTLVDINRGYLEKLSSQEAISSSLIVQILVTFSAYTNTKKVFHVSANRDGQMNCLNAIRVLSMMWVILGHTFAYILSFLTNVSKLQDLFNNLSFQFVSNATFSVDSFFLLSGLLTVYMFMKTVRDKGQRITPLFMLKYYVHRYWRITPPYAALIFFNVAIGRYISSGPFVTENYLEPTLCSSWWTNLLYISNLVEVEKMCFPVSWYLSNDMQFYVFAPLVIIPLTLGGKWKWLGLALCAAGLVGNIAFIIIILINNPGYELGLVVPAYFNSVYITPWSRVGPYLVGLLLGYSLFFDMKKKKGEVKLHTGVNIISWLVAIGALVAVVLIPYGNLSTLTGALTRGQNIAYQAGSRLTWALALAYVIRACLTHHGGPINRFLSLSFWIPLARLSFAAYLIHTTLIFRYYYSDEHGYFFTAQTMVYLYVGHIASTFVGAFLFHILVEAPFAGLEKFIFGGGGGGGRPKQQQRVKPADVNAGLMEMKEKIEKIKDELPPVTMMMTGEEKIRGEFEPTDPNIKTTL